MGKVAIGCFIDLKKAFEIVNDFILINKLRKYGIHGKILEWFISYLDNRKHYVFYNGSKSNDSVYIVWCSPRIYNWSLAIYTVYQ